MEDPVYFYYLVSFLLGLVVVGLLWWVARKATKLQPFWRWVAAGWTLNWLGSLAWGIYEQVTGRDLPLFSLIDVFYLGRYLLVWWAVWRFPARLPSRRLSSMVLTMAAAMLLAWMAFDQAPSDQFDQPGLYLFALATYPVLDAGVLYALWLRLQSPRLAVFGHSITWFAASIVAYTAANVINYLGLIDLWDTGSWLTSLLWLLCDLLMVMAAVGYWRRMKEMQGVAGGQTD